MKKIVKKTAQQMAQLAKSVGEAVVEEGSELGRSAVKQVSGVELPVAEKSGKGTVKNRNEASFQGTQSAQEEQHRQEQLAFYRRQIEEMKQEQGKIISQDNQEQLAKRQEEEALLHQKALANQPSGQVEAPGGASKRGTALRGGRGKRKKGFELGGQAAKRSK
ncbi:hypothetical protein MUP65_00600 [Patescibacteria group bacterium]|nr:hypothetical protein [Patescibacteria group bacterium]